MPRFVCNHNATAIQRFVLPSGKVLMFDRGVLDTDEEGAKIMRAHTLYNRTIFEGDESVPAHGEIPPAAAAAILPPAPTLEAEAVRNTSYCVICEVPFASEVQYRRHMKKNHGEEGG